jgi:hypothetical protein
MTDPRDRMIDLKQSVTPLQQAVVVSRGENAKTQTVVTPGTQANLMITALTPVYIVSIRTVRVYLQTLSGLLLAAGLGAASTVLPPGDFGHLLKVSAGLSIAPAAMCALQNFIELLAKLDQSNPQLRP